jgi:uncharacterized protein involved in cysteine biosynthesis
MIDPSHTPPEDLGGLTVRPLPFDPRTIDDGGPDVFRQLLQGAHAARDGVAFAREHRQVRGAVAKAFGGLLLRCIPGLLVGAPAALVLLPVVAEGMKGKHDPIGALSFLFLLLSPLLFLVLAVAVAVGVAIVIAPSTIERVCRATEEALLGRVNGADPPSDVDRAASRLVSATTALLLGLAGCGVYVWIRVLGLLPGSLTLFAHAALAVWLALLLSFQCLSYGFSRHGLPVADGLKIVRAHKAIFVGFGLVALLHALVPLSLPVLVVAAHRLYLTLAIRLDVPSALRAEDRQRLVELLAK